VSDPEDLARAVEQVLANTPGLDAKAIARILRSSGWRGLTKLKVNSVLYAHRALFERSADTVPRWKLSEEVTGGVRGPLPRLNAAQRTLLSAFQVPCLYSLQSIGNLKSIERHGIVSRNAVRDLNLRFVDVSDSNIQKNRSARTLGGRPLHDYVPLFFRPRTPMQYDVCIRDGLRDDVALLQVAVDVFAIAGVLFTDRHAFSGQAACYSDLSDLKRLDWEILNKPYVKWPPSARSRKGAEVLVPDAVAPCYIERIAVSSRCELPRGLQLAYERDDSRFP
jgi:hypothetical protein